MCPERVLSLSLVESKLGWLRQELCIKIKINGIFLVKKQKKKMNNIIHFVLIYKI